MCSLSCKGADSEELERRLSRATTIDEACVVAQEEGLCVVVVPAALVVASWKGTPDELEAAITNEVTLLSENLPPDERPSQIYLHPIRLPRTPAGDFRRELIRTWLTVLARHP